MVPEVSSLGVRVTIYSAAGGEHCELDYLGIPTKASLAYLHQLRSRSQIIRSLVSSPFTYQ